MGSKSLTPAQIKALLHFPRGQRLSNDLFFGQIIRGREFPKGTYFPTLRALVSKGYVRHAYFDFWHCPMELTAKGRAYLEMMDGDQEPTVQVKEEQ